MSKAKVDSSSLDPPLTFATKRGLASAFQVFTRAAHELEEAYDKLRAKGNEIDRELRLVNQELRTKVKELDDLNCYLEGLLEALPSGVLAVGKDGEITFVNQAAEKILGVERSEIIGRTRAELSGDHGPLLPEPVDGLASGTAPKEREIKNFRGEVRKVEGRLADLFNPDGEIQGRIEILDDRTEVVRLRERVNHLDNLAALGEMAAGMAHEIRNPLYGSLGFVGLLEAEIDRHDEGGGSAQESFAIPYAQKIRSGIERVVAIIESVLSFCRPTGWVSSSIDIFEVLEDTVEAFFANPNVSEFSVLVDFPEERPFLEIDPVKMMRVFENLLSNAVEASLGEGEILVRGEVCGEESGSESVVITIEDRGSGIDPSLKCKVFHPFFTTKETGTGLGLFFSQRILSVYDGSLEILAREGGGATVRLQIPVAQRRPA